MHIGFHAAKGAMARYMKAPLLKERQQYLDQKIGFGTSLTQVRAVSGMLLHVIRHLELSTMRPIQIGEIQAASRYWMADPTARRKFAAKEQSASDFQNIACGWFRFHNMLLSSPDREELFGTIFEEYILTIERTLSPNTALSYGRRILPFLRWAKERYGKFSQIRLEAVEEYISSRRNAGNKPRTIVALCQSLRSLFRYSEMRGWTRKSIAQAIVCPRISRYDDTVKAPSWKEVRGILVKVSPNNPSHLRARAILMLCSIYGLRAAEVSRLSLSDFDWANEVFTLVRAKRGRPQRFPIQHEVGGAILDYLKGGRPICSCRSLFVSCPTPHRGLLPRTVRDLVKRRLVELKVHWPTMGTHPLRHACATRLLQKGSSLRDIADLLGHGDLSSVGIYARCSAASIRAVAAFSLEGLV